MKAIFVGGIIWYTYKEGLWSSAFRSACFLGKFVEKCPPEEEDIANVNEFADLSYIAIEDPEACQPFIPHSGYILYRIGYYWNQVVIFTFWLILSGPMALLMAILNFFRKKPTPPQPPECPL